MTDERTSNLDLNLKIIKQSKNIKKVQKKLINLQNKFNEEKNKNKIVEEKNIFLENEMKILKKEMNEVNTSLNKKICELKNEIEQNKNLNYVFFIQIKNKWKDIDGGGFDCCGNNCINNKKPYGNCVKGNGYINLINDENIKYINCVEGRGKNQISIIFAENEFKNPKDCINYSLFYFEIKCKIEGEKNDDNLLDIGLVYCDYIFLDIQEASIQYSINKEPKKFKLPEEFSWKDGDIFGCGLVYPPINKMNELPYVFFTQNGKQIGKAILFKSNHNTYQPQVDLKCCSVEETNFGNDLINKPFIYDISKHFAQKEFCNDSDIYVSDVEDYEIESDLSETDSGVSVSGN